MTQRMMTTISERTKPMTEITTAMKIARQMMVFLKPTLSAIYPTIAAAGSEQRLKSSKKNKLLVRPYPP